MKNTLDYELSQSELIKSMLHFYALNQVPMMRASSVNRKIIHALIMLLCIYKAVKAFTFLYQILHSLFPEL